MRYRFADCTLDTQLYTLERAGQRTRLAPKVFEVLCYLIEHRDGSSPSRNYASRSGRGWRLAMPRWRAACVPCGPREGTAGRRNALSRRSAATDIAVWRP
jgi:hypothetical protein